MYVIERQLREVIEDIRHKQKGRRKKIHIDQLEEYVIHRFPDADAYRKNGGYRIFQQTVMKLKAEGGLIPLTKNTSNGRNPTLETWVWVTPLFTQNQWSLDQIARVSDHVNLDYYLRNKEEQSDVEWRKIEIIHLFLKHSTHFPFVSKEQRSLMLFSGEAFLGESEAEKWLDSQEGKALMKKLKLTPEQLRYYEAREPFIYWRNDQVLNSHILIIENLSAYHTCKELLKRGDRWDFGPVPHLLIWGGGSRIESTIHYLEEVIPDPKTAVIHYAGDLDYSGISIYVRLKEKNKSLHITPSQPFYNFMIEKGVGFRERILKDQRRVDSHLTKFLSEFNDPHMVSTITLLWFHRERIAQEVVNEQLMFWEGDDCVI